MTIPKGVGKWWSRAGIDPVAYVGGDEARVEAKALGGFLAKARKHLGKIPMARETLAMYYCLRDPTTPRWAKAIVAAALAYFVLPFDAVPDLLPIIGLGDDASILAAAYSAVAPFVTDAHRDQARAWIEAEGPA